MAQLSDKTAYHFIIRCLKICQKVKVASKQSDDITYHSNLVQQLFIRTLERGIASPYVLSKIYLKSSSADDEALILAVKKAAAAERDRKENFSSKSKKAKGAKVSAVETGQAENSLGLES